MSELKTPYKGLIPYSAEDAEFFFGREHEQNIIMANLLAERLTLLYGASGVGKSSVLRAGVENHLRLLAKENIERLGKPKYVVVFFNEWRETDPVRSLLLRVGESVTRTMSGETFEPVPSSLGFAESLLEWSKRVRGQLLIVMDQFEEYFLYHQNEDGERTFAEEFPRAVRNLGLPANFLVSFREDAFAKMTFFKLRMPDLFGNYLPIDHLDREAGREAIIKPIEQYNKKWANGQPPVSIEPALVEEVLKQVETGQVVLGDAGRGTLKNDMTAPQIETPFLQMVMTRLWEEDASSGLLRLSTLKELGDNTTKETGAERIVRTHLDKMMKALPQERQNIAAEVFHYLVTPGGTKIAHTVPDLAEYAKLSHDQLSPVLEDLAAGDRRILRGVADKRSEPRYEIFHDVLAAPILDWRSRHVRDQQQVKATLEAKEQAREEEKAKFTKRKRVATGILLLMFLVAAAAVLWAWGARNRQRAAVAEAQRAAEARAAAEQARQQTSAQSKLLAQIKETEEARAKVEEERNRADKERLRAVGQSRIAMTNAEIADKSRKKVLEYSRIRARLSEDELAAFRLWRVENKLQEALALYKQVLANYGLVGETKKQQEIQAQINALTSTLAQNIK